MNVGPPAGRKSTLQARRLGAEPPIIKKIIIYISVLSRYEIINFSIVQGYYVRGYFVLGYFVRLFCPCYFVRGYLVLAPTSQCFNLLIVCGPFFIQLQMLSQNNKELSID